MSNRSNIDDEMAFLSQLRVFINQEIKEKTNEINLTNDYTQMALNYIRDEEVKELSKSIHTPSQKSLVQKEMYT